MSKRNKRLCDMNDEELEQEARKERERLMCRHEDCSPVSWYWSGAVKEMVCHDCFTHQYLEEPASEG